MQNIRPSALTNEELQNYTQLVGPENIPSEWVGEIIKRTTLQGIMEDPHAHKDEKQLTLF